MSTTITPTASTTSIDYIVDVPFRHSLQKSNIYKWIKDAIIQKLEKNSELQKMRSNHELTLLVCYIIEHSISNNSKHHKVDKTQLASEILTAPFGLNPQEIQQFIDRIDSLDNNNKIVKYNKAMKLIKTLLSKLGINLPKLNLLLLLLLKNIS